MFRYEDQESEFAEGTVGNMGVLRFRWALGLTFAVSSAGRLLTPSAVAARLCRQLSRQEQFDNFRVMRTVLPSD